MHVEIFGERLKRIGGGEDHSDGFTEAVSQFPLTGVDYLLGETEIDAIVFTASANFLARTEADRFWFWRSEAISRWNDKALGNVL